MRFSWAQVRTPWTILGSWDVLFLGGSTPVSWVATLLADLTLMREVTSQLEDPGFRAIS